MTGSATHRAIDAVWRIESARLIAGLTRVVRDVAVAEDLAQDALVAAMQQWPREGIPTNPGVTLERKRELIGRELQILQQLDRPDPPGSVAGERRRPAESKSLEIVIRSSSESNSG
jgi:hypothetical protein